jgi:hypothetical protein
MIKKKFIMQPALDNLKEKNQGNQGSYLQNQSKTSKIKFKVTFAIFLSEHWYLYNPLQILILLFMSLELILNTTENSIF